MQIPPDTKIAKKIIFLGLAGCLQCEYLVPLFDFAHQNELAEVVSQIIHTKEGYEQAVMEEKKRLGLNNNSELPVPFVYVEVGDSGKLAKQEVLEEIVLSIREDMNDDQQFEYFDHEFNNPRLLINYLTKIITETLF